MAFVKDKTGSAQTAANASAVVVAAFADSFKNFDAAVEAFNDLRTQVFEDLSEVVDKDNAAFAAADGGSSKTNGGSKSSGSKERSSSRSAKTGGGSSKGSNKVTLDEALAIDLSFGAFKGETLEHVLGLTADECDEDYGYGDGERDGRDYIKWLAGDSNKNPFIQLRARLVADDAGIDYDA